MASNGGNDVERSYRLAQVAKPGALEIAEREAIGSFHVIASVGRH